MNIDEVCFEGRRKFYEFVFLVIGTWHQSSTSDEVMDGDDALVSVHNEKVEWKNEACWCQLRWCHDRFDDAETFRYF
jgi:hypothetical protein